MDRANATSNRFERRANLYLSTADAQAQRIADDWNEQPADSRKLTNDEIRQMWSYSPSAQPESDFWALHDHVLADNLAQLGPGADPQTVQAAHNDAELQALSAVYPNRAQLAGLGYSDLGEQVHRAAQIQRLIQGQEDNNAT